MIPRAHIFFSDLTKSANGRDIVRCAKAFNIEKVHFLKSIIHDQEYRRMRKELGIFTHSGQLSEKLIYQMDFNIFEDLEAAKKYFKKENFKIVGIEIEKSAKNVLD